MRLARMMPDSLPVAAILLNQSGVCEDLANRDQLVTLSRPSRPDSSTLPTGAPGFYRRRRGRGFRYIDHRGRVLRRRSELDRIARLAIPPAWKDVWICPNPKGHLQACGRDARGRKQYRYHTGWRQFRDEAKYDQMLAFGLALPALRRQIAKDLSLPGLPRRKVIAAVVQLLEKTLIRVGNDEYARDNNSFGLTTMRNKHVRVSKSTLRFRFKRKGREIARHRVQRRSSGAARPALPGPPRLRTLWIRGR